MSHQNGNTNTPNEASEQIFSFDVDTKELTAMPRDEMIALDKSKLKTGTVILETTYYDLYGFVEKESYDPNNKYDGWVSVKIPFDALMIWGLSKLGSPGAVSGYQDHINELKNRIKELKNRINST